MYCSLFQYIKYMFVTITKEHCIDSDYSNIYNCPLAKALKEIMFEDVIVGGTVVTTNNISYTFNDNSWNILIMEEILSDAIPSLTLEIPHLELIKT